MILEINIKVFDRYHNLLSEGVVFGKVEKNGEIWQQHGPTNFPILRKGTLKYVTAYITAFDVTVQMPAETAICNKHDRLYLSWDNHPMITMKDAAIA